jgi:hypothetical protein
MAETANFCMLEEAVLGQQRNSLTKKKSDARAPDEHPNYQAVGSVPSKRVEPMGSGTSYFQLLVYPLAIATRSKILQTHS